MAFPLSSTGLIGTLHCPCEHEFIVKFVILVACTGPLVAWTGVLVKGPGPHVTRPFGTLGKFGASTFCSLKCPSVHTCPGKLDSPGKLDNGGKGAIAKTWADMSTSSAVCFAGSASILTSSNVNDVDVLGFERATDLGLGLRAPFLFLLTTSVFLMAGLRWFG